MLCLKEKKPLKETASFLEGGNVGFYIFKKILLLLYYEQKKVILCLPRIKKIMKE